MVACFFKIIIGYINLWPTYAIFSEFFNIFSLAWYSTLHKGLWGGWTLIVQSAHSLDTKKIILISQTSQKNKNLKYGSTICTKLPGDYWDIINSLIKYVKYYLLVSYWSCCYSVSLKHYLTTKLPDIFGYASQKPNHTWPKDISPLKMVYILLW